MVHAVKAPSDVGLARRIAMVAYTEYASDPRVRREAETLVAEGHRVEAIVLRPRSGPSAAELDGVHLHEVPLSARRGGGMRYLYQYAVFFLLSSLFLFRLYRRVRFNLIYIHSLPDFQVFCALPFKCMRIPVLLDLHEPMPEIVVARLRRPTGSAWFRISAAIERLSCLFADHVIVANHPWRDKLLSRSIRDPQKCTTILNFPDASIFFRRGLPKTNSKFVILYPGSLNHHQGVDLAIRAFALIRNDAPNAEFHIYGEGDQKAFLKDLIGTLGLENRVFLNEIVPLTEIATVMEAADVGVVPKRKESFGNEAFSTKILEFMSVGVPVIVSDTEIDKYYFDESIVKFFRSSDEKDLAHGMLLLIQNAELRRRLAANAEAFIKTNTWEVKKTEYLELVDHRLIAHGSKSETP